MDLKGLCLLARNAPLSNDRHSSLRPDRPRGHPGSLRELLVELGELGLDGFLALLNLAPLLLVLELGVLDRRGRCASVSACRGL